jgi:hypothetical protein
MNTIFVVLSIVGSFHALPASALAKRAAIHMNDKAGASLDEDQKPLLFVIKWVARVSAARYRIGAVNDID